MTALLYGNMDQWCDCSTTWCDKWTNGVTALLLGVTALLLCFFFFFFFVFFSMWVKKAVCRRLRGKIGLFGWTQK